jgi:hypothetical protein
MRRRLIGLAVIAGVVALLAGRALAEDKDKRPDATLTLSGGSAAAGVGWNWGKGTLNYHGKAYTFKIEGLSIGEVGVTKAEATGNVYNLRSIDDFDGVYLAASTGAAAGKGVGVTSVRNPMGVVVNLTTETKGVNLKIAAEGLNIKLER